MVSILGSYYMQCRGLLWILSTSRAAVGAVRPAQLRPVGAGQVLGGDGRPALGHPHGAPLRHHGRRRDEEAARPQHAGTAGAGATTSDMKVLFIISFRKFLKPYIPFLAGQRL